MKQSLRDAIEAVIHDAKKGTVDAHGFVNYMDSAHLAVLVIEYDAYCKKHGLKRVR